MRVIDKDKLEHYINKSFTDRHFYVDKLSTQQYAIGYAHDEKGYFTYKVSERQSVSKHYKQSEQECIDSVFKSLKEELEANNQSLPDLTEFMAETIDYSENDLIEIFNRNKNKIEQLIIEELGQDCKEFKISELGKPHINTESETISFDNSIPGYAMFVTLEYEETPADISMVIIDG